MEKLRFAMCSLGALLAGCLVATSCGTSQSQLQSISLTPPVANADDFPSGQVPFTATGVYVHPSRTVTPFSANWVACQNNRPTNDVSITDTGTAQCHAGATGTYSIDAWDIPTGSDSECTAITACGGGCTIEGTAELTCP